MTENVRSRDSDEGFLFTKRSSVGFHTLYNAMDCFEMLPDKMSNSGVLRDGLVRPIRKLILRSGSLDRDIVCKWLG